MNTSTAPSNETKYLKSKEWILYLAGVFFYTIVHGIMMFLAGVPFFFYKLTGKTKEDIHNQLVEKRMNSRTADFVLEEANEAL